MLSIFLSALLLAISIIPTHAFTYSSYMDIQALPEDVVYTQDEVEDIGNMLKAPPQTEVVFGVKGDFNNDSVVADIFCSKDNIYQGDLTKILDIELPYGELNFLKNGSSAWRYGRYYHIEETILQQGENPLLTVTISQPIEVLEFSFNISNGVVEVKTVLKNGTERLLNNVGYLHDEFSLTKNYQPGEEYTYEYSIPYDEALEYVDLGSAKIQDPNIKQICAAGAYTVGNPHNIFLSDVNGTYHDIGTQDYEDFCITQLGYILNLEKIEVGEKPTEQPEEEVEDEVTEIVEEVLDEDVEKEIGEVLGIEILPKTAKRGVINSVLGVILSIFGFFL